MEKVVESQLKEQIDRGRRCQDWLHLETTQEFIQPLRDKLTQLKELSYDDLSRFDDKSFRSKVEASFLAAKELEDYFAYLDDLVLGIKSASDSIEGKDVEKY